ncbi:T9SS type A sorting domain-containing protein [Halosquirtibacter xylanolyticus]|uniref:T9SS type A sorting domain-containing protein n=1 Tax=Halosquirtibacter xylanolyticus TaxID=3374599 RepID=UPI0037485134|nr:T9SS type A sorting domain-containing protein [Prolixibacteraceae bacterium]
MNNLYHTYALKAWKRRLSCLLVLLLATTFTYAQDKIKILHQNILYYGKDVYDCDQNNNDRDVKTDGLKDLFKYVQPDIFTCNEMDDDQADIDYLLDNALNQDGRTSFVAAPKYGSYLLNQLYYDSNKLELASSESLHLGGYERSADFYSLNTKDTPKVNGVATEFIHIVLLHLKSSAGSQNESRRAEQIRKVMVKLDELGWTDNVFIIGDLNLYNSNESAYQQMVDATRAGIHFSDPISQEGAWHNEEVYSLYHTQSTHMIGGCSVGGGSDDRFDFILTDSKTKEGEGYWKYVKGSYDVVGQDGKHFNMDITDGINDMYPSAIINAIYNISDHYPVTISISKSSTPVNDVYKDNAKIIENPVEEEVRIEGLPHGKVIFEVYSSLGVKVDTGTLNNQEGQLTLRLTQPSGIYVVKIIDANGDMHRLKVVKK